MGSKFYKSCLWICVPLLLILLVLYWQQKQNKSEQMREFPTKTLTASETDSSTNLPDTLAQITKSRRAGDMYRKQINVPSASWNTPKIFNSEASDDPHIYSQKHFGRFNPDAMASEYYEPEKTYESEDKLLYGLSIAQ
jgi:FtsZ-interacting cell division protein ZipA